mgnify:CR=1 FL=1
MKMAKRILSLVLVLAMVACLGVTAFADTASTGTATINVVANGRTKTIQGTAGNKLSDVLDANIKTLGKIKWKTVTDWQDASVTHKALVGIGNNVSKAGTTADLHNAGKFLNVKETAAVANHPGYYLVEQNGNSYHYVYVGYDWTYTSTTVGGGDLYTYMCCYTLTAGETVTITYSLQITDWTQTGAIQ